MVMRNIVEIDEDKCNGCGDCVGACAEGAIKIIDGKAKLISEIYCDGLGACLGHCPQDAISIEKRQAEDFDEEATEKHLAREKAGNSSECNCPGTMGKMLRKPDGAEQADSGEPAESQLGQWPVQLKLVSPAAPYFANADLLLVADCVPFAMGDFHSRFLKGKAIAIGCPKLDDSGFYIEKFAEIIKSNNLKSLTVIHMEVPCCSGLTYIARQSIEQAGVAMGFEDVTIGLDGGVRKTEMIEASLQI